jgi:hypothetical protein
MSADLDRTHRDPRLDLPAEPVMLDPADATLHRARPGIETITRCGLPLASAVAGPFGFLHEQAGRLCPDCWDGFQAPPG